MDGLFDTSKTLNAGVIQFSQLQTGWQNVFYQKKSIIDTNKRLSESTDDEWNILKYGTKENIKIKMYSQNVGQEYKMDYETAVYSCFERLYLRQNNHCKMKLCHLLQAVNVMFVAVLC